MPLLRCQKLPCKSYSVWTCVELLRGTRGYICTQPLLDPLNRWDGTLFSWIFLFFYSSHMINQGNASAWTSWCYMFADLYLQDCCQLYSELSGWLTHVNTHNAEVSGQPFNVQGCFWMLVSVMLFQLFLSWFSCFTVVSLIFLETSLCAANVFF